MYDIYKNIPSRNHIIFNSLEMSGYVYFQDIGNYVTSQYIHTAGMLSHELSVSVLRHKKHIVYCKSAMLPPIFLKCQGSKLWKIDDILCLKYRLFLFISEYDMYLTIMYVL
jgi:hypothetical protein